MIVSEDKEIAADIRCHITIIQGVITRLANHNMVVRNWTFMSLAGIVGVEATHDWPLLISMVANLILLLPGLWMMIFYHWQEAAFIHLYNQIAQNSLPKKYPKFGLEPSSIDNCPSICSAFFQSKFNKFFVLALCLLGVSMPILNSAARSHIKLVDKILLIDFRH